LKAGSLTLVAGVLFGLSCAHDLRKDPAMIAAVKGHRASLDRLPRCSPDVKPIEIRQLLPKALDDAVAVRGLLVLEDRPECTLMYCRGGGCCNTCFLHWVLVSPPGPPANGRSQHEVRIVRSDDRGPLSATALDCQVPVLREMIPRPEVIVTGTVLRGKSESSISIFDASLCVVERK
jgi:hypothetical protein